MELAAAVESWGHDRRKSMTRPELERLGDVWRTIRSSPYAGIALDEMTKDDARAVMALFERAERREVSDILNDVRAWAMGRPTVPQVDDLVDSPTAASAASGGFASAIAGTTGRPTVVVRGATDDETPVLEAIGSAGTDAAGGTPSGSVTVIDGDAPDEGHERSDHGPVDGWQPRDGTGGEDQPPWPLIGAVVAMALLALILWTMVLTRGDDPADESEAAEPAAQVNDVGDFCSLASELDRRLPLELGPDEFTAEWFLFNRAQLERLVTESPVAIRDDLVSIATHMAAVDELAGQFLHDRQNADFVVAVGALDQSEAFDASNVTNAFLADVCNLPDV